MQKQKTVFLMVAIIAAMGLVLAATTTTSQVYAQKSCGDDLFSKRINGGGNVVIHCIEEHKLAS
jgi:hypothetical protein